METGFNDFVETINRWRERPPQPVVTYVPRQMKDALESRPDWPELETRMKSMYGPSWRLVAYEEGT